MPPSKIRLYGQYACPPVRCVLLTAKILGIPLEFKIINLLENEHKSSEFLKINFQHTLPTLDDGGYIIWESQAIITYLVNQYGPKDCSLYPVDPKTRGLIDQKLHFYSSCLTIRLKQLIEPVFHKRQSVISPADVDKVYEAYDFLEYFLSKSSSWLVGETMTLADISCFAIISTLEVLCPVDETKHPKITAWLKLCKDVPNINEINQRGVNEFHEMYLSSIKPTYNF